MTATGEMCIELKSVCHDRNEYFVKLTDVLYQYLYLLQTVGYKNQITPTYATLVWSIICEENIQCYVY